MQVEAADQLQQFQHANGTSLRKTVLTWACFIGEVPYNIAAYSILPLIASEVIFYAKDLLYTPKTVLMTEEFTMLQRILCVLNLSYISSISNYDEENDRKRDCMCHVWCKFVFILVYWIN